MSRSQRGYTTEVLDGELVINFPDGQPSEYQRNQTGCPTPDRVIRMRELERAQRTLEDKDRNQFTIHRGKFRLAYQRTTRTMVAEDGRLRRPDACEIEEGDELELDVRFEQHIEAPFGWKLYRTIVQLKPEDGGGGGE